MKLKALTIIQPWASAIMLGFKRYETRGWLFRHRGPLVIHAGLADNRDFQRAFEAPAIRGEFIDAGVRSWTDLPRGAVLGIVNVTACHAVEDLKLDVERLELQLGDFSDGRYAIECQRPMSFDEPVPARGLQGLWNWEVPEHLHPVVNGWLNHTEVVS